MLNQIMDARKMALTAMIFNTILCALLIISFVINCCTIDSTLKGNKQKKKSK